MAGIWKLIGAGVMAAIGVRMLADSTFNSGWMSVDAGYYTGVAVWLGIAGGLVYWYLRDRRKAKAQTATA